MTTFYYYYDSPIGELLLVSDGEHLSLLGFPSGSMARKHEEEWVKDVTPFKEVIFQLQSYFNGELEDFDLPLALNGTKFQKIVWNALMEIPYGTTWSYGQLAKHIGRPTASRAVGTANRTNPIPIIIPCHRVIGANGTLTGFGGGIEAKEYLIKFERNKIKSSLNVS
ncbi:MAG: cysteine methyltransferase [Gammaproteobacteria bacterium]|nr:cysteine methyltransferase [Gammaproteobacteria bacterium]|tara:strand:- start:344 stop:844 length:501 start_codon:yes stop_codon:yes gene_type:complete